MRTSTASSTDTSRKSQALNRRIVFWAITSALAGFLFGFDTVVISGAEQTIQALWGLSAGMHGLAMALGALRHRARLVDRRLADGSLRTQADAALHRRALRHLGGGLRVCQRHRHVHHRAGHRRHRHRHLHRRGAALHLGDRPAGLSRHGSRACSSSISSSASSSRSSRTRCSPASVKMRGAGCSVSRRFRPLLTRSCASASRKVRAGCSRRKGDRAAGVKVLRLIEPDATADEIEADADDIVAASSERVTAARFWTWRLRVPILLAFLIAFFNQLSGINAILYFAPRIFEMTGLGAKAALLQSVGIGITNLIFTFVGLWLIDRLGRRTLLYIGSFGYIASLGLTRLGVLHGALRHRAGVHLRLHRRARHRPGRGDLGVHLGNLSEPSSRRRPDAGQLDALGLRRAAHDVLSQDGVGVRARLRLPVLLRS